MNIQQVVIYKYRLCFAVFLENTKLNIYIYIRYKNSDCARKYLHIKFSSLYTFFKHHREDLLFAC